MRRTVAALPALALLLIAAPALAGSKAQPAAAPKLATRDELRACMDDEDGIKLEEARLRKRQAEISAQFKQFQDDMSEHVAGQSNVDIHDAAAVDAFNKANEALNARVPELNARSEAATQEELKFNEKVAGINKRCASIVFLIKDRDAILKERAAKAASK